ncbi:hypothetical protein CEXT_112411 [Caerostris extrusa]|uniref:Uncharacterized protein n=1 Tax=Caerostris extrusa TaxID=172846 RepID=A0AAV4SNN0_CAEEX|nr:hypothetical protein CEXT_112411 [Caerostris extrusa]
MCNLNQLLAYLDLSFTKTTLPAFFYRNMLPGIRAETVRPFQLVTMSSRFTGALTCLEELQNLRLNRWQREVEICFLRIVLQDQIDVIRVLMGQSTSSSIRRITATGAVLRRIRGPLAAEETGLNASVHRTHHGS